MTKSLMFNKTKILVVGDVMLDIYKYGTASRISPEAPVPVVLISEEKIAAGGAANVAVNLCRLGCQVELIGYVGNDHTGRQLRTELTSHGVFNNNLVKSTTPTTSKTRILAGRQHMIRYDNDSIMDPLDGYENILIHRLLKLGKTKSFDAIVVSDYAKGTITPKIMQVIKSSFSCPILCDIKPINSELFYNVFCITPNLEEARQLTGMDSSRTPEDIAWVIKRKFGVKNVVITMSKDGILLVDEKYRRHRFRSHIVIDPNDPVGKLDVTGAGDTVISTIAACVAAKKSILEAVRLSNFAAGVVVRKTGTAACGIGELQDAYLQL